ncbi:MAG: hypothetical protein A2V52_05045 [Actinobacteria bacterium RBG_19FT_COMBO_54_7]|uniref:Methionine synthase n=1 Tax=Candidatus Solincola sediminis TaxID=1797199 RepID=A0A1F2WHP8_9ACTN|nr:MAG: hypothetical protein A2Y75_03555 [Candidatus Solincola sediminis]OFW58838.1 MAG: hypothetical protein A2W01_01470 [Candidatus Solincola sediminis]OFW70303.1 MAG: hypothetical protein A2V52_05045 [Actinobacteria bacterium RBG_19FT_COMBO_54_7]
MGIMPHLDPERALDMAFSLDIPFWPQLPNLSFNEDTYVQTVAGFPGAEVDYEGLRITFDEGRFYESLEEYLSCEPDSDYFAMTPEQSATYGGFLDRAGDGFPALRGQFMGPISLCLMVKDSEGKPIIYRDDAREIAIRHVAAKVNRHLADLRRVNPRSFVWVDEPGLEFLFTGISGYTAESARKDLALFLSLVEGPRGVHLCGNPDWDFLLQSEVQLISLDAYNNREILMGYRRGLASLLARGGAIAWGAVPTHTNLLDEETPVNLAARMEELWLGLEEGALQRRQIINRSFITPATCCLVNPDLTATVEKAFGITREVRDILRESIA